MTSDCNNMLKEVKVDYMTVVKAQSSGVTNEELTKWLVMAVQT